MQRHHYRDSHHLTADMTRSTDYQHTNYISLANLARPRSHDPHPSPNSPTKARIRHANSIILKEVDRMWDESNRGFAFLSLPKEVRNDIYILLFTGPSGKRRCYVDLLRINREITHEITAHFFRESLIEIKLTNTSVLVRDKPCGKPSREATKLAHTIRRRLCGRATFPDAGRCES